MTNRCAVQNANNGMEAKILCWSSSTQSVCSVFCVQFWRADASQGPGEAADRRGEVSTPCASHVRPVSHMISPERPFLPRALRPGDPGFCARARVPMPSNKDYVVRPKWNVEVESNRVSSRTREALFEVSGTGSRILSLASAEVASAATEHNL